MAETETPRGSIVAALLLGLLAINPFLTFIGSPPRYLPLLSFVLILAAILATFGRIWSVIVVIVCLSVVDAALSSYGAWTGDNYGLAINRASFLISLLLGLMSLFVLAKGRDKFRKTTSADQQAK